MFEFRDDIQTTVPTSCLIEDYQALRNAINNLDWEEVESVMDCLAATIDRCTHVPADLFEHFKPSPSSVIVPSCKGGILLDGIADFLCAHHLPISKAMAGGVCQCNESCPYYLTKCNPEGGAILADINGKQLLLERNCQSDEAVMKAIGEEIG